MPSYCGRWLMEQETSFMLPYDAWNMCSSEPPPAAVRRKDSVDLSESKTDSRVSSIEPERLTEKPVVAAVVPDDVPVMAQSRKCPDDCSACKKPGEQSAAPKSKKKICHPITSWNYREIKSSKCFIMYVCMYSSTF
jgi:hypothetical protein